MRLRLETRLECALVRLRLETRLDCALVRFGRSGQVRNLNGAAAADKSTI